MHVDHRVKDIVEDIMGEPPFSVGDIVEHPEDGTVRISSGQYWGSHGISNFWTWVKIDENGDPVGEMKSGYGWTPEPSSPPIHP